MSEPEYPTATTFNIYVEHLETRYGLWCDNCSLPSAFEIDYVMLWPSGPGAPHTLRRCLDCEP